MNLTVYGKRILNKRELADAIPYMLKMLNLPRITKTRNFYIRYAPITYDGMCWMDEAGDFEILISDKLSKKDAFYTLAHELVHVKQFVKKELKVYMNHMLYKGEYFDIKKTDYYDLPSEIEAYGRQEGLVVRYLTYRYNRNKQKKKSRTKRN